MIRQDSRKMLELLFLYMEKVEKKEVDTNTANTICKLVAQASNILSLELKRAMVLSNPDIKKQFRDIETIDCKDIPNLQEKSHYIEPPLINIKLHDHDEKRISQYDEFLAANLPEDPEAKKERVKELLNKME